MTHAWDTKAYSQFLDYRTRPAKDLLQNIPETLHPKIVYDLGCGPGNSTIILKNRWPHAYVAGVDTSSDMLQEAKSTYPQLEFFQQDIAHFSTKNIDCLFANASLQWLGQHDILIPHLISLLSSNGVFACQMPNNFHSATHQTIIELLNTETAWQPCIKLLQYGALNAPLYQLHFYYDLFAANGMTHIQLWETEYFQEMPDHQAIYNWIKGTGLRPVLAEMDADSQSRFEKMYVAAIAKKYPLQHNQKVLLPFKRIFVIGMRVKHCQNT